MRSIHNRSASISARTVFMRLAVLLAVIAMLAALFPGCSAVSLSGAWHNEDLQQVLRFHDDGTVVIRTAEGDFEAKYIFDGKTGQGMVSLDDQALTLQLAGDDLVLSDKGVESTFVRGEMDIQVAAASPSQEQSQAPSPTPEPSATVSAEASPSPSNAPPTPKPSASISVSKPSIKPIASKLPKISGLISGDIINKLVGSIVGSWVWQDDSDVVLTLKSDKSFVLKMAGQPTQATGTYKYNATTKTGQLDSDPPASDMSFTVDGDTMTWHDGKVFKRK